MRGMRHTREVYETAVPIYTAVGIALVWVPGDWDIEIDHSRDDVGAPRYRAESLSSIRLGVSSAAFPCQRDKDRML